MQTYKSFIHKYISLNIIEWTLFSSKHKVSHHKKGEILHHAGDIFTHLRFINYGIARAYIIDEKGKDHTWSIYFNDENAQMTNLFLVDYHSFIHQCAADIHIEILEDCELLTIGYDDVHFLYKNLKKWERFGRMMSESAYTYTHNYIVDRMTKNATQRFQEFMRDTPYLMDKVPQYHIATLLSITPQSLSRLKKRLT